MLYITCYEVETWFNDKGSTLNVNVASNITQIN